MRILLGRVNNHVCSFDVYQSWIIKGGSYYPETNKSPLLILIMDIIEASEGSSSAAKQHPTSLPEVFEEIPKLIDKDAIKKMVNLQVAAIDRLESTNKSLINCNTMAQNKLSTTAKLYKKTSKQLSDSKKDLDVIYKKILDLKAKIRAERPELFCEKTKDAEPELAQDGIEETSHRTNDIEEQINEAPS